MEEATDDMQQKKASAKSTDVPWAEKFRNSPAFIAARKKSADKVCATALCQCGTP